MGENYGEFSPSASEEEQEEQEEGEQQEDGECSSSVIEQILEPEPSGISHDAGLGEANAAVNAISAYFRSDEAIAITPERRWQLIDHLQNCVEVSKHTKCPISDILLPFVEQAVIYNDESIFRSSRWDCSIKDLLELLYFF